MKKLKKILFAAFTVAILSCLLCQPAFAAISESDVQAQVDAVGKEAVSGNVFIWFLCAIGFLKVGQKIDSFLSSLGVNVGHTGGSMLAEAMIAARGIGGIKNFSSHHFGGGRNSSSTNVNTNGGKGSGGFGAGFASGGLAGVVSRKVTNSAIKTATTTPGSKPSGLGSLLGDAAAGGIGGHMYASSVSKGGNFANNVIGSVATGSISQMGSISGEKAAEALHSYMGYAALESGAENIPTFQNVEIGGGRITGTEVTEEHPEGISFGMYHADQYVAPEGQYTTVHAVDGTAWYKQYAVDAVDKSPYFLVTSDQDSTFDFLASLFLSFCFIKLVRYADHNCEGGKLPVPVHILGEELTACGTIPDLSRRLSVIRSRNISMSCVFQNLAGLQNRYPQNLWQEIIGNCDAQLFLGCTDQLTAEFISARTGLASVAVSSKSKQLGTWRISNYTPEFRETSGVGKRPVLTPDEVLRLPLDQALIIIRGKKVLQVDKMDYSKHPEAKYLRSCKASAHVPEWRRLEEEAAKTPQPAPKPAPAAKKPAKRKATKPASPTDKSPKEAPAPKSAGTPEGIITTDKDSILS